MRSKFIPQIEFSGYGEQSLTCCEFMDVIFIDDFGSELAGGRCKKLRINFVDGRCEVHTSGIPKVMNVFCMGGGTATYALFMDKDIGKRKSVRESFLTLYDIKDLLSQSPGGFKDFEEFKKFFSDFKNS